MPTGDLESRQGKRHRERSMTQRSRLRPRETAGDREQATAVQIQALTIQGALGEVRPCMTRAPFEVPSWKV